MTFPKEIMTLPELMEMGFTRKDLTRYFHKPGQKYAWRKNSASNVRGHIIFDTEIFNKELEREKEIQARVRERRVV